MTNRILYWRPGNTRFHTVLGEEGGNQRVIAGYYTDPFGLYLAVRIFGRYRRLSYIRRKP